MKIYIELVVILSLMLVFIGWRLWFDYSQKKAFKNYKPEDNLSKINDGKTNSDKGGIFNSTDNTEQGTTVGTTEPRVDPTPTGSIGSNKLERRELLQKTVVSNARKNSSGTRKTSSSVRRRFFGRRKDK